MLSQKRGIDQVVEMSKAKVSVKWGKELFSDVEVDLNDSPLVFKSQLFALTGVPPDRMKVMIKGALLKDDEWGKAAPKDGATIMVMGSADAKPVEPPKDLPKFVEDLPESQQNTLATREYGSGLQVGSGVRMANGHDPAVRSWKVHGGCTLQGWQPQTRPTACAHNGCANVCRTWAIPAT